MENARKVRLSLLLSFAGVIFFMLPASAASLFFSPSSYAPGVGDSFSVGVYVGSAEEPMNAAQGTIDFPADKAEVLSLSKSGTVFNMWIEEPTFSNATGKIGFDAIVLNPGYKGASGKVMTINLRAKAAGTGALAFTSGAILANDGKGTPLAVSLGKATLAVKGTLNAPVTAEASSEPTAPTVAVSPAGKLPTLAVSSPSHPSAEAWYSKNVADFRWSLPKDATAVSLFVDKKPASMPNAVSDGRFETYSTKALADGEWYFHIRAKNGAGWGPPTHYRFRIDTVKPEDFMIRFIDGAVSDSTQPVVVFNTTDGLSGIAYYEVKVGGADYAMVSEAEVKSNPYTLPIQEPGTHRILVVAVDNAGNHASASADFVIDALEKPVIDQYPTLLNAGEFLVAKGRTDYPDAAVTVWMRADDGAEFQSEVRTDPEGSFTFVADGKIRSGVYKLWAQVADAKGAKSPLSDQVTVVAQDAYLFIIAGRGISIWYIAIPVMLLIALSIAFALASQKRYYDQHREFGKKVHESKEALHHALNALRLALFGKLDMLEKSCRRGTFTKKEAEFGTFLRTEMDKTERAVEKHIDSIKLPKKY